MSILRDIATILKNPPKAKKGASMLGGLFMLVFLIVAVATVIIPTIKNQSTAGWSNAETALWGTISLFIILGVVYTVGRTMGFIE